MKLTENQINAMAAYGIPQRMQGAIIRYYERGLPPGDFLTAVISNDLRGAIERAGDEDIHLLKKYVMWLYNWAPGGSWGSEENMRNWINHIQEVTAA